MKKHLKTLVLFLALVLCISGAVCTTAGAAAKKGLVKSGKTYYYYQKGKKVKNKWKTVKSKGTSYRYYFGKNGAAYAGRKKDGVELARVKKIGKHTYAFDSKGRMLTGIRVIHSLQKGMYISKFYVFSANGRLDSIKTARLRELSAENSDAAPLKELLAQYGAVLKSEADFGFGCYGDGTDGALVYHHFTVNVFNYSDGRQVILSLRS